MVQVESPEVPTSARGTDGSAATCNRVAHENVSVGADAVADVPEVSGEAPLRGGVLLAAVVAATALARLALRLDLEHDLIRGTRQQPQEGLVANLRGAAEANLLATI